MTVAISVWQQNNRGLYVKMSPGETDTFAIDVHNELDASDELLSVTATVDTGLTLLSNVVRINYSLRSRPHQMMVVLRVVIVKIIRIPHLLLHQHQQLIARMV